MTIISHIVIKNNYMIHDCLLEWVIFDDFHLEWLVIIFHVICGSYMHEINVSKDIKEINSDKEDMRWQ